jgi:hypothetical protein
MTSRVSGIIANNQATMNENVAGTSASLNVGTSSHAGSCNIDSIIISNNISSGIFDVNVLVSAYTGEVNKTKISNNITTNQSAARGVQIIASGNIINDVQIDSNSLDNLSNEGIYLQGAAAYHISNARVNGNIVEGGTISLRATYVDQLITGMNQFTGYSSSPRSITNTTGYMAYDIYGTTTISDILQSITIASDTVTLSNPIVRILKVDTEAAAAADDLSTISGGYVGQEIIVMINNSARDVTCKDGVGNLKLGADRVLNNVEDTLKLIFDGTSWYELSFADNGA